MAEDNSRPEELFADLDTELAKYDMTREEYVEWIRKNNPEIDFGKPVGEEYW